MSAPLFLVPALPTGDEYTLAGPEGHHAAVVQRLRPGEVLVLGDGRGATVRAAVIDVGRAGLRVRLTQRRYTPAPSLRLTVAQGLAKGARGELAVQAMTEVGADAILPWTATRSIVQWHGERGEKARQRWVSTAREAAKQSRRAWLPEIAPARSTDELRRHCRDAACALVLHEDAETKLSAVELPREGEILVVVGPEGGITPAELDAFTGAGATAVRLGADVLRTSTAGVAALAAVSVRTGRW